MSVVGGETPCTLWVLPHAARATNPDPSPRVLGPSLRHEWEDAGGGCGVGSTYHCSGRILFRRTWGNACRNSSRRCPALGRSRGRSGSVAPKALNAQAYGGSPRQDVQMYGLRRNNGAMSPYNCVNSDAVKC